MNRNQSVPMMIVSAVIFIAMLFFLDAPFFKTPPGLYLWWVIVIGAAVITIVLLVREVGNKKN
ncbi:hypothetical protein [Corynebacterium aquatimens]|uniref:PDZ domain-containing secreted protein n=1 Tax=Corynebacterium aquatimens TaxID=1190508 RepID=A0A931E169_9CORY|nr:hypothetical protein [Corynebacterium aquatimens]MBG6121750.1 PDZ domain-containing secreted protein [Corynebacterium aquatimens]WJY65711.1 hypothetical protein CAQUA_04990 [Corynebacterium aquatimens]